MDSVFDIGVSRNIARAIADENGLTVREDRDATAPSVSGTTITIPPPTIYNHTRYMQELHSCINQASKDNRFFNVEPKNDREGATLQVLRDLSCDLYQQGKYKGRDNQLQEKYANRKIPFDMVEQADPDLASLMALGDRLRSHHQGSLPKKMSQELRDKAKKMDSIGDKWMSLRTEEDLRDLLKSIEEYEEQPDEEQEPDEGDEGESGEGDSKEGEGKGGKPDGDGSGDTGEPTEDDQEGGEGEDGDPQDPEEGNGDSPDGDPQDEDKTDPSDGSEAPAVVEPVEQKVQDMLDEMCPSYSKESSSPLEEERPPYTPSGKMKIIDSRLAKEHDSDVREWTKRHLEDFTLSKKIRKYLLTLIQDRTTTGLRRGQLAPSKISRMYSNTSNGMQPRMFKQKQSSSVNTDIAFSILIDHSGSMGGDKFPTAAACGVAIQEVLAAIDISHEIITFSTMGDTPTTLMVKEYSERFVPRDNMLDRFSTRARGLFNTNADGESIMWAMERLAKRPEREKVMLVLSDGSPNFSSQYGSSSQYLKDVVKEIEGTRGVDILGIGIQDTSVKRFYKRYKVLRQLPELEAILVDLIREKVVC